VMCSCYVIDAVEVTEFTTFYLNPSQLLHVSYWKKAHSNVATNASSVIHEQLLFISWSWKLPVVMKPEGGSQE